MLLPYTKTLTAMISIRNLIIFKSFSKSSWAALLELMSFMQTISIKICKVLKIIHLFSSNFFSCI